MTDIFQLVDARLVAEFAMKVRPGDASQMEALRLQLATARNAARLLLEGAPLDDAAAAADRRRASEDAWRRPLEAGK